MKSGKWILVCTLAVSGVCFAQSGKTDDHKTVSQIEDRAVGSVEGEFVPTADAVPEDKYSFVPPSGECKGVRTFAQQIKHVASVNYMVGAAILEEKSPVDVGNGENG